MTPTEAAEFVEARTRHPWTRLVASDPDRWGPTVLAEAAALGAAGLPELPPREPPAPPGVPPPNPHAVGSARLAACPHRGRRAGCNKVHCARDDRDVYLSDCRACLGPRSARELVVARYREAPTWLEGVGIPALVYDKGGGWAVGKGYGVVRLPAVGREAHTYLWHICSAFDALADVTLFTQADPFDHSPDFLGRLGLDYDGPTTLTTRYLADRPPDWIKARDRTGSHRGFPVRYGDAAICDPSNGGNPSGAWFNPAAWDYVFRVPMPRPLWFGYGACWAVPRAAIERRGLPFWRWLLAEVVKPADTGASWTTPPINAWALEAMWLYLFSDPADYPHHEHCRA